MSKDDKIVFTAIFVGLVIIVLLLGLFTKGEAAEIKTVRSPINARHIGSWLRLSNEIIITPTFDVVEPEEERLADTDKTLESDNNDYVANQNDYVAETDVGNIATDQIADDGKMVEPDPQDLEWLAIAIFREAGSDWISNETRYMVGDVILTHVIDDRFPNTLYGVLTEKGKYGRFYWDGITWPSTAFNSGNKHAAERAREIAYNLLTDAHHSELWGKGYIYQDNKVRGKDSVWSDGICFGR